MNEKFRRWLEGDTDVMAHVTDSATVPDLERERIKEKQRELDREILARKHAEEIVRRGQKYYYQVYRVIAVVSCFLLIGVLLFAVAHLPRYGQENDVTVEVVSRYVEHGLEETGAVNIVAGMILDYRAFDTLGESHVLFTALICVMVLLGKDAKNMDSTYEDYYAVSQDIYFDTSKDAIIRRVGIILVPSILLYGVYILLNGQNGPGGGFSGGAVIGAGLIIFAVSFGLKRVDKYFTEKVSKTITVISLGFYSFAKGYVFFTGANGLENHIPKGTPGAILSGGLILPLDIAVGLVVACTMFGFYSLFKRGSIGSD